MTSMDQIHRIRDLYYGQDKSLKEIADIEKIDWRTARKYVDMEDFNEAHCHRLRQDSHAAVHRRHLHCRSLSYVLARSRLA